MEQSILRDLIYRFDYGDFNYEIKHYKARGNIIKLTLLVETKDVDTNGGDNAKTSEGDDI